MAYCPPCKKRGVPAWTLTFANVVLLMLAIFIALLSASRTDQSKSVPLINSFRKAFGVEALLSASGSSASVEVLTDPIEFYEKLGLLNHLADLVDNRRAVVETTKDGFLMQIELDALFVPGSLALRPEAKPFLHNITAVLASIENVVQVVGYADNIPLTELVARQERSLPSRPQPVLSPSHPPLMLTHTRLLHRVVDEEPRSWRVPAVASGPSLQSGSLQGSPLALIYASAVVQFLTADGKGVGTWRLQTQGLPHTVPGKPRVPPAEKGEGKKPVDLTNRPRVEILISHEKRAMPIFVRQ